MSNKKLLLVPQYHADAVETIVKEAYGEHYEREDGHTVAEEGPYTFFVFKFEDESDRFKFSGLVMIVGDRMRDEIESDYLWDWTGGSH